MQKQASYILWQRYADCGKDVICSIKDNFPCFFNACQDNHLPTSYKCPVMAKHKLVLSFAAENLPFMDARRKILQSTQLLSHDLKYDFRNFSLIDTGDTRNA